MSGVQTLWNYCRQNPVAFYIGGGILLHIIRNGAVNSAYKQNFLKFDIERRQELEKFMNQETK